MSKITKTAAFYRAQFKARLKELRQYTDKFDYRYNLTHLDKLDAQTRRRLKSQLNSSYRRLRPYIHRPTKRVALPRAKKQANALKKFAGVVRFRYLKRVPVPTYAHEKARVTVSKKGDVSVIIGKVKQKTFFLKRRPKKPDEYLDLFEELAQHLPRGVYVLRTTQNVLLRRMFDRDLLLDEVAVFLNQYKDTQGFVEQLEGVTWLGQTEQSAERRRASINRVRREQRASRKNVYDEARKMVNEARKRARKKAIAKSSKRKPAKHK